MLTGSTALAVENSALRADNERLRAALEQVAMIQYARTAEQAADYFQHVAREALRPYQQQRGKE